MKKHVLLFINTIILCILSLFSFARGSTLTIDNVPIGHLDIVYPDNEYIRRYVEIFSYHLRYVFTIDISHIQEHKGFTDSDFYRSPVLTLTEEDQNGTELDDDGFAITIGQGPRIKISSGTHLGLIYGLFDLLELMRFRFYMPGPYGTVYPQTDIGLNAQRILSEPAFSYRNIGDGEWALIAYRANVNLQCLPAGYGKRIWGNFHTFDKILPAHDYFATNRSYFADRTFPLFHQKRPFQLATENPEVMEVVAKTLADLSHEGFYDLLTLAPSDNRMFDFSFSLEHLAELFQPFDQMFSKRMLSFYNRVAVKYHHYGGTTPIRFGAYDVYTAPPEGQNLHLEEGLIPFIAHFDYCQIHRLGDPGCKKNFKFVQILNKWKNLAHILHIYEYPFKHNWLGLPWPFYMYTIDNIKDYYNAGARGYHGQFSENNTFPYLLNYYLTAKALWNPHLNYNALKSEFFTLFYEQASPIMERCYNVLENDFSNHSFDMSGNAVEHYPLVFSRYSLQSALELANRAYQFTSSSIIQARINMMIIWLEYSLDMLYALDKDNKPRCANAIMRLIEDASEKGYPIFDRQMLLKYPFINRLSTDGNINTPK